MRCHHVRVLRVFETQFKNRINAISATGWVTVYLHLFRIAMLSLECMFEQSTLLAVCWKSVMYRQLASLKGSKKTISVKVLPLDGSGAIKLPGEKTLCSRPRVDHFHSKVYNDRLPECACFPFTSVREEMIRADTGTGSV